MTVDRARIESLAKDAGERVAYAGETLRGLIETLAGEGATSYDDEAHKIARKVFAETLAAKGRTKNSGLTQYAQAWDAVRESGTVPGMSERSRKGKGRNADNGSSASDGSAEHMSATEAPAAPTMSNAEAIAKARPYIAAEAVMHALDKHGLTWSALQGMASDLAEAMAAAKKIKMPKKADAETRAAIEAARQASKDALFVARELGKLCQGLVSEADDKAVKYGFRAAPTVPADSPAAAPSADTSDMSEQQEAATV